MYENDSDHLDDEDEDIGYGNDSPDPPSQGQIVKATEAWRALRANITSEMNKDGSRKTRIRATKMAYVSALIHLDGKNFDFTGRRYLEPIYNRKDNEIIMKNARQTEKSTYLSNDLVIKSLVKPFSKSLYVSPSHMQTRQFSSEKLKPILDNSPLIKTYFQDTSVSQQVFEKGFLNGSFIFLRSAYRSADRCLPRGSDILLESGLTKKIELLSIGDSVIAYKDGCRTVNTVTGQENNGIKKIGRLTLISGHEIECTHNHRFQTDTGLKRLDSLTVEDFVPIPFDYAAEGVGGPLDLWMGLTLSDGCLVSVDRARCSFNNNDKDLVDLWEDLSRRIGLVEIRRNERKTGKKLNYTATVRTEKECRDFLDKWGLACVKFDTKFIPEEFFHSRGRISKLLQGYFEGNGWASWNELTRQCEVGCVTASKSIAFGILRGLQSLGISCVLETWEKGKKKTPGQTVTWYCIKIRSVVHIKRFSERVGFINKQSKLDDLLVFSDGLTKTSARDRDVPAREDCADALAKAGISCHSLWEEHGISFRNNGNTKKLVAIHKVKKIYDLTKDARLLKWLRDDVRWVGVKKVEQSLYEKETYDIEVRPDHVFSAQGVYTHNTRGISAANLYLDEIQDLIIDQIPVIRECTSHFIDALTVLAGTPKSLNNPIEVYWKASSQNEWLVKCKACGKWNFLDEKNIAPTKLYLDGTLPPGPVCKHCFKPIDVVSGQWVSLCPSNNMKGYRVPQLMVPWICGIFSQWVKLLWKRDNYPISQLYNEVLGLSYDSASSPITQEELVSICGEYAMWDLDALTLDQVSRARGLVLTAGVDWGEGIDGSEKSPSGKLRNASYTVLTLGYYHTPTQFKVLAIKKFTGREVDPDYTVQYIARVCKNLGVQLVGVDWGHGWGVNNQLVRIFGAKHVVMFQYLPKLKDRLKWDPIGFRYHLQRNFMISEFFYDLKNGHVLLPKWSDFEPYSKDFLSIYTEYNEFKRDIKYDHRASEPDDCFHSMLLGKLVCDIHLGKSRRYTRIVDGG